LQLISRAAKLIKLKSLVLDLVALAGLCRAGIYGNLHRVWPIPDCNV